MRLMKMFGLAAIAAVAAMAFIGATSASATKPTQLCKVQHAGEAGEACPAGQATTSVHIINVGVGELLTNLVNVLCLHVLGEATVGALAAAGARQFLTTTTLLFANCGSVAAHNNCTVTVVVKPSFLLLKTALNLGNIKADGGSVQVKCTLPPFGIQIDCTYGPDPSYEAPAEGALHTASAGHGMITLNNAPAVKAGSGPLCPSESRLDALLEPLSHSFIAS